MKPIRFGIIGGGWRALFYLRIAHLLPDTFEVGGMLIRDASKGQEFEKEWGVKTYRELDELLNAADLRFVVVSVPWSVSPIMLQELAKRHMPALAETPPAPNLDSLRTLYELVQTGAKIQVAEQYHLQPLHAARLAIIQSGKLGTVTHAQVSAAHGYHGISLIRRSLGVTFENATISARRFTAPLIVGPDRNGPPTSEETSPSVQVIAQMDFGDKLGIYDFTGDQYFSWIRSPRLLVRGERGEINDTQLRYLADFRTPNSLTLLRQNAGEDGNLEGYYHKGILAGSEWVYTNPFSLARLSDDEIAIASCLSKMDQYVEGGPELYSLAEAAQDHYLNLMLEQALASSQPVSTTTQPWATPTA
ncbi:MAG TPA: Gfo/Idh/MocA family oxidoreductase [Ktedonobacteraceae bacterium]